MNLQIAFMSLSVRGFVTSYEIEIQSYGLLADIFRIRYSTKYIDAEAGLYYYGYRFYSPALMRWLTRDPIDEDNASVSSVNSLRAHSSLIVDM